MRIGAYQKRTLRTYIENLLDWGDELFRQDTLESINEAWQLYALALRILGPRPVIVDPPAEPQAKTFAELEPLLDEFSNALVKLESVVPVMPKNVQKNSSPELVGV
ncbi:MAG: hypothetical protein HY744_28640 [Deltaproteobacteria bacterium]|nr:hypothetical protein [Deltaproteobacteria bacterium]